MVLTFAAVVGLTGTPPATEFPPVAAVAESLYARTRENTRIPRKILRMFATTCKSG
jgi:hypothetical protein